MEAQDIWLWPVGRDVRWWSAEQTRLLEGIDVDEGPASGPLYGPNASEAAPDIALVRDRRVAWPIERALKHPLGVLLSEQLEQGPVRLHLHRDLPDCWQLFPFEWLRLDGVSLHGRLAVSRLRPPDAIAPAPTSPADDVYLIELLSPGEPNPPSSVVSPGAAQIIPGRAVADLFLQRTDLTGLAALCVVAHGSERADAPAFRLDDGTGWDLPMRRGLPPLVILLACGDDQGNLIGEARRALTAGALSVLAPLGRPSVAGAGEFLREFLPRWRSGERLDDILSSLAATPGGEYGARRLLLLGRGDLRMDVDARPTECDDQALAAMARAGDQTALRVLIQRLTLHCIMQSGQIDKAESLLRALLDADRHDEAAGQWLLRMLAPIEPHLPLLSRAWVSPLRALLADAYDHSQNAILRQTRRELEAAGVPMSAPILHYWSKLYYREGMYRLALQDVANGLRLMQPGELSFHRGAGLIRHLAGLLVDLDLPSLARALCRMLEDHLRGTADDEAELERFLLRDTEARASLRLGQAQRALHTFQLKHGQAARFESTGRRELAWMIYVSAWADLPDAQALTEAKGWVVQACMHLRDLLDGNAAPLGLGNFDDIYLLRACAAWGWRRRDPDALTTVLGFRDQLAKRLRTTDQADPGPPGFCLTFLRLAERDGVIALPSVPSWDAICVGLESKGYFFELAALACLMGHGELSADYLERFQCQRELLPGVSFPDWLLDGALADWRGLCEGRGAFERDVLTGSNRCDPDFLVKRGLLPL